MGAAYSATAERGRMAKVVSVLHIHQYLFAMYHAFYGGKENEDGMWPFDGFLMGRGLYE